MSAFTIRFSTQMQVEIITHILTISKTDNFPLECKIKLELCIKSIILKFEVSRMKFKAQYRTSQTQSVSNME